MRARLGSGHPARGRRGRSSPECCPPARQPASQSVNAESVLNGIAYDAQHDRLFVTGKQWPTIFEIKAVRREQ